MTGWPLIPPEHESKSFQGSPFPGYDDDEFADFQTYGGQWRYANLTGDRCAVHARFLSKPEFEAGGCFWCEPWLDVSSKRHRAAERPSESDAPEAVQASF